MITSHVSQHKYYVTWFCQTLSLAATLWPYEYFPTRLKACNYCVQELQRVACNNCTCNHGFTVISHTHTHTHTHTDQCPEHWCSFWWRVFVCLRYGYVNRSWSLTSSENLFKEMLLKLILWLFFYLVICSYIFEAGKTDCWNTQDMTAVCSGLHLPCQETRAYRFFRTSGLLKSYYKGSACALTLLVGWRKGQSCQ